MRLERVASEIKKEISLILSQELRDPRLGFVTITRVKMSPDLREAWVYFSVLADKAKQEDSLKVLSGAAGYIRRLIGQRLRLRFNPEIKFKFDKSIAYSIEIEERIRELKDEKEQ
ncbi:MAG: 30S ribosome-binding factor RbfA [Candidatus Omnitrophica bacterium]|nr:30S ribosome-binding factor RbfA [Candidatus Omnitrophota bacterium]